MAEKLDLIVLGSGPASGFEFLFRKTDANLFVSDVLAHLVSEEWTELADESGNG